MTLSPFLKSLVVPALCAFALGAQAAEPFFRSGDVVALVGGEEMVEAAEAGELEFALTTARPELHLTFRSLAWEGDTVYEQRRDLNYPTVEEQLTKMHATAVILQFGQMESLGGKATVPEFIAAYEKLLDRMTGSEGRRLLLVSPHKFTPPADRALPDLTFRNSDVDDYAAAIRELAKRRSLLTSGRIISAADPGTELTRDGIHLNLFGQWQRARAVVVSSNPPVPVALDTALSRKSPRAQQLLRLIQEKNRLWFNYYRPQNWAFLAGDRINQPSSRDHLDPTRRWLPGEMEEYVPLLEKKDHEIWDAAATFQPQPAP